MGVRASLRAWGLSGICGLFISVGFSQDQRVADSLVQIYNSNKLEGIPKMELLHDLAFNENHDFSKLRQYARELISLATALNNSDYLQKAYLQLGHSYRLTGNFDEALNAYFKSRELALKTGNTAGEGSANMTIADVYSIMDNHDKATEYYDLSIRILRKNGDSLALGKALANLGDELLTMHKYDQALVYFEESIAISRAIDYQEGIAYNMGNIGMAYIQQGNYDQAEMLLNQAISILQKHQDQYGIAAYLGFLSELYIKQATLPKALDFANRSLALATEYGLREQMSTANLQLSKIYELLGKKDLAFDYYKDHITYRDSLYNIESVQQLANLRSDYEVSQRQGEVDLLNQQQKNQKIIVIATAIALFLISLLAIGLFRRNRFIRKTNSIIEEEQKRSDKLLLNILPEETAQELKENGKVLAKKFESVTVMFTDFKGFTKLSENLSPEELVENVDYYFSQFDRIVKNYGLEKIKTMGDSYMCAGGLHSSTDDHAYRMVLAAFEIVENVERVKEYNPENKLCFDIRIGINTGPVVAGVVGTTKIAYDIWGDTVNVASRMETMSETGKVNISANTYELIKSDFDCEPRGEIQVKNRGMMQMYYVNPIKSPKSETASVTI